jgi:hypothetical protein
MTTPEILPISDLKKSIDEAMARLNEAHQSGKLQGLFAVADIGNEDSALATVAESLKHTCANAARYLLNTQISWGPPPSPEAGQKEMVEYFLQRATSDFIKGTAVGLAFVLIDDRRPDDPAIAYLASPECKPILDRELQALVLRVSNFGIQS